MKDLDYVSNDGSLSIPTIDFSKIAANHGLGHEHDEEMAKLHQACKDWGFFQLVGHGVAEEVVEKMKTDIEEFLKLPLEEKMAYAKSLDYYEGYRQASVKSYDQKLDWGDIIFIISQPISDRNFKFWPAFPPTFRESLDKYSSELQRVTLCLVRLLAKNLGIDSDKAASLFVDGTQGTRINFYLPSAQLNKFIGFTAHTDPIGVTLLSEINQVQGFEIMKNGKWIPVNSTPGAFIFNVGDVFEILSNGEYKCLVHRATANQEKERLSIATFQNPNKKTMIGPLPELVKDGQANYKSITYEDFYKALITCHRDGKHILEFMKLTQ